MVLFYRYVHLLVAVSKGVLSRQGNYVYQRVGLLIWESIAEGGSSYPFVSPSTFPHLWRTDICSIVVNMKSAYPTEKV